MAKASYSNLPCFEFMLLGGDAVLDCGKGHCGHGRKLCLLGLCGICLWPRKSFESDASQELLWCRAGHCVELLAHLLASTRTALLLECLQALRPNSLVWFGTKCSSWVSLCVSCSCRSPKNLYHGDEERAFVLEGNRLMMVTSLPYFLASCLGHFTALEQPQSSKMVKNRWLQNVLVWVQAQKFTTYKWGLSGQALASQCSCGAPETRMPYEEINLPTQMKADLHLEMKMVAAVGCSQLCRSQRFTQSSLA